MPQQHAALVLPGHMMLSHTMQVTPKDNRKKYGLDEWFFFVLLS